ncbi:hypothetical protein [Haloglomus salinum]|uniref:hypothetical protein n=1 Tax=Haloglomus salinum TaxID=2962673 RepID=UPI0020C96CB6|nr:hypothetical protein [Haloglomus salinum]
MTTLTASNAVGHPETEPDNGLDNETFATLWSGDVDITDTETYRNLMDGESALVALAAGTDIPLDEPPEAVEQWNRADIESFPRTDHTRSVFPVGAPRENGTYLTDVTVSVFAVQPSTRALTNPNATTLLVPPGGVVLGTTDYRVLVPVDDRVGSQRETWTLVSSHVVETRLLADGDLQSRSAGEKTPVLSYAGLDTDDSRVRLTLETEVAVELSVLREERFERCRQIVINETTGETERRCRMFWQSERETIRESVTVRDSTQVRPYTLSVTGQRTRYPDDDIGLSLRYDDLWLGYETASGEVNGVWRFYVARDPAWDTLVSAEESGRTRAHSPLHPLQVHAYPFEPGPTTDGAGVRLLGTDGVRLASPELPEQVHLDTPPEVYETSFEVTTRVVGEPGRGDWPRVRPRGLVRGVGVSPDDIAYPEVVLHRSNLSLSVLNVTHETATIRVSLRDAESGAPIDTSRRTEPVYLGSRVITTDSDGLATVTIPRPAGGVTARYEPREWWRVQGEQAYLPDSETVYVRGAVVDGLSVLYTGGVPVALFLFAVFLIDRITHWGVWPPWRGL